MDKKKKKLIGVFGGSFDPPHIGHLKVSTIAIKKLKLNKLLWIVTKKNPLKQKAFFSLKERVKKSKDILKKNKKISVRHLDNLVKSSNTIDTLKYLVKIYKNCNFFLIIGSDNLIKFHKWKNWKKLITLCKLVVFSRRGFDGKAQKSITHRNFGKKSIIYIKNTKIDISSSKLRKFYLK